MSTKPRKPGTASQPDEFGAVILLLTLVEKDGPTWAYVAVPNSKAAELLSFSGKPVAPEHYGKVLLSGQGTEPPAEAREYIYDIYGFDS